MPQKRGQLTASVYDRIKRSILSLHFQPGETLQERSLAEWLGVSRTPVREAVQRLSQEGWLRINARKSLKVRQMSYRELHETFTARRLLELHMMELLFKAGQNRQAAFRMERANEDMILKTGNLYAFIIADQEFHAIPFQVIDNACLSKFWRTVSDDMIWFGMQAMNPERYDDVIAEHGLLTKALAARQRSNAREHLLNHLEITEDMLVHKLGNLAYLTDDAEGEANR